MAGVAAAGGGLRGRHTIGFRTTGVTPPAGKHIQRILRFRIVVKDSTKRHEIFSTQVITCDGQPVPVSMTYVDSLGTKVGKERPAIAGPDRLDDMDATDARLAAHDVTPAVLAASVPARARAQVRPFVRELLSGAATPFDNKELTAVQARFPTAADSASGPYKAYARMGKKKYGTADDYYEIAGMNGLLFPRPGTTYYQRAGQCPARRHHRGHDDPPDVLHDEQVTEGRS